jgi:hypothetical protein
MIKIGQIKHKTLDKWKAIYLEERPRVKEMYYNMFYMKNKHYPRIPGWKGAVERQHSDADTCNRCYKCLNKEYWEEYYPKLLKVKGIKIIHNTFEYALKVMQHTEVEREI